MEKVKKFQKPLIKLKKKRKQNQSNPLILINRFRQEVEKALTKLYLDYEKQQNKIQQKREENNKQIFSGTQMSRVSKIINEKKEKFNILPI